MQRAGLRMSSSQQALSKSVLTALMCFDRHAYLRRCPILLAQIPLNLLLVSQVVGDCGVHICQRPHATGLAQPTGNASPRAPLANCSATLARGELHLLAANWHAPCVNPRQKADRHSAVCQPTGAGERTHSSRRGNPPRNGLLPDALASERATTSNDRRRAGAAYSGGLPWTTRWSSCSQSHWWLR